MQKQTKNLNELHQLVIAALRTNPKFDEVEPHRPYIHEVDDRGSNWDISSWQGPRHMAEEAKDYLMNEVTAMRTKYLAEN